MEKDLLQMDEPDLTLLKAIKGICHFQSRKSEKKSGGSFYDALIMIVLENPKTGKP